MTCRLPDRCASPACASLTCTGSNLTGSAFLRLNSPWRYCRRQLNTWLAFTPCANATRATDAPGFKVCSTIRHFSATGHRRLCGSLLTTARSEVSIYSPSGHSRRCPLRAIFHTHPHFVEMYRPNAYKSPSYCDSPSRSFRSMRLRRGGEVFLSHTHRETSMILTGINLAGDKLRALVYRVTGPGGQSTQALSETRFHRNAFQHRLDLRVVEGLSCPLAPRRGSYDTKIS